MWLSRVRSFLLGIGASAVVPLVFVSGGAAVITDYVVVAVFVVGPAHQTVIALRALRRSESPIRGVLRAGAAFWAGATIGLAAGCMAVLDDETREHAFTVTVEVLAWSLTLAASFTAVIAAVTGSVHAWRVRS